MEKFSPEQREEIKKIVREEIKKANEKSSSTIDSKLLAKEVEKQLNSLLEREFDFD